MITTATGQHIEWLTVLSRAATSPPQHVSSLTAFAHRRYIVGEIRTGSPNDETLWLPNKEMTKPCEVSDETSTNLFPHF
jgi:hypothetical protein